MSVTFPLKFFWSFQQLPWQLLKAEPTVMGPYIILLSLSYCLED